MTESLICGEQHPEHDLVCTRIPEHDGAHKGRDGRLTVTWAEGMQR